MNFVRFCIVDSCSNRVRERIGQLFKLVHFDSLYFHFNLTGSCGAVSSAGKN